MKNAHRWDILDFGIVTLDGMCLPKGRSPKDAYMLSCNGNHTLPSGLMVIRLTHQLTSNCNPLLLNAALERSYSS
ncbi:MAG: hypothetical protein QGH37_27740 [Candidatus Poribacteria bacterium]|jgi:hypothetical protein|nr:hypothetical protein [Candidatus Poribacteria bacterium]